METSLVKSLDIIVVNSLPLLLRWLLGRGIFPPLRFRRKVEGRIWVNSDAFHHPRLSLLTSFPPAYHCYCPPSALAVACLWSSSIFLFLTSDLSSLTFHLSRFFFFKVRYALTRFSHFSLLLPFRSFFFLRPRPPIFPPPSILVCTCFIQ